MALKLVGLSGSLRKASFNSALLESVSERLEGQKFPGVGGVGEVSAELSILQYRDVPWYDADIQKPQSVVELEQAISAADAVLIATPEYNYGIPGVLKNAIDWASRPGYNAPFTGKPVAIMGASPGAIGTARAQGQLKQVLLGMASQVFPYPEFNLGQAPSRFSDGKLTDDATLGVLDKYLSALMTWVQRVAVPR